MSRRMHRLVLGALLALAAFSAPGADKDQKRLIGFDAEFLSQGVPTTMVAGQSYAVSVTMSNNGSDGYDWYDAALESQNPTGNTTWGLSQVPVGTSVPPGYDHIFNFTVVAPSTPGTYNFQWRMRVISGSLRFGDLTPNVAVVVTAPNQLPTVSLTTPSNGASYTTGQTVAMTATASDSDGSINRVEFLVDGAEVGEDPTSPYAYNWTATTGAHTVQARAVDNQSGTKTTTAININVTPPNQSPTVSLTAPANGASYAVGASVPLQATASDSDGTIDRVEFFVDGTKVTEDPTSPYSKTWTATAGTHTIVAKAWDDDGAGSDPSTRTITVTSPNQSPTVSLTAPANGASYAAGASVPLQATASDSDGTIDRVEFFVDGTKVTEDTTSPYSKTWTATAGTHAIMAKAWDDDNADGTSSERTITVTAPTPPVPTLTLPTSSDTGSYTVSWTGSSGVDHYELRERIGSGSWILIQSTSATSRNITGKTDGSYTYRVRACAGTGTGNCSAYSTTKTITVTIPPAPVSITRTYRYNSYQELCAVDEPETGTTLMGYDAAGNLAWSASGLAGKPACSATGNTPTILARKVVRTYDARNRIDTLTFPDNNGNQSWDYTPDGLPESITTYNDGGASSVINSYLYNKRRLPVSETLQADTYTWTVAYAYTGNGHLASLTYPDSLSVDYTPNALGQPTQAGTYATNVTYYPNGAIAGFTYGNGIVHTMTQNARGLPERSRDANGLTSIHDDSYDYDANGNVLAISDGVAGNRGDRDMVYDDLDRLVSATSPMFGTATYAYDAVDNLTHVQVTGGSQPRNHDYCYDAANQLTNVKTGGCSGGTSVIGLGYDVQGNLANKNGVTYAFDYGNRLRAGGPETYRYDAHGRRVRSSSSAGLAYSFYSQSGQILFQRDERSSKRRQYIYLGGSLVAESTLPLSGGTATVTYQHTDALGSPVAITNSSKTVIERREYEPFGYQTTPTLQDGPNYTGHVADAATGLVYMQQRYYDPMIPRFLSVDAVTVDSVTGWNFCRYCYAANIPYKFTDPDGRAVKVADESQRAAIEKSINALALGVFKFDRNGSLMMVRASGDSTRFSATYQTALVNAINSDKDVNVSVSQTVVDKSTGKPLDVDRDFGGGVTGRTENGVDVVISGNTNGVIGEDGSTIPSTGAQALMHEIVAHAVPEIGFPGTGNGIENENQVRDEVGLPLRRELPHPETR